MRNTSPLLTVQLPTAPDAIAPDGSEIRLLPRPQSGVASLVHCRLPSGATAKAVSHRTVEEVWYVVAGNGELWRRYGTIEEVTALRPRVSVNIPLGTRFQFRATGDEDLEIVIATFPPWPEAAEAMPTTGRWPS